MNSGAAEEPTVGARKYLFVVLTNPVKGREAEFNDWYETHVRDTLKVPGIVAAQRFWVAETNAPRSLDHQSLVLYEIETDDLDDCLQRLRGLVDTPAMILSDALDRSSTGRAYFEPIGERVVADPTESIAHA